MADLQQQIEELERLLVAQQQHVAALAQDRTQIKRSLVSLHSAQEQDQELVANTLLKRITALEAQKHALEQRGFLTLFLRICRLDHLSHSFYFVHDIPEVDPVLAEATLKRLKQEKIELENLLDQECESLVLRLTKENRQLETDKHKLELQLQECPHHAKHICELSDEVLNLKQLLQDQARHSQEVCVLVGSPAGDLNDTQNQFCCAT
jgi:hypothetical protein